MQTVGYKEGTTYGGLQRLHSSHCNTSAPKKGRFSTQFSYPSDSTMEEYAQTVPTPPTIEEDQQGTPLIPVTTEYMLPDVDPRLSMKKVVEVKVETSRVEQGEGDTPVRGVSRQYFTTTIGNWNPHITNIIRSLHEDNNHVCQVCTKVFKHKSDLRRHIKSVHQGEKPYHCPECGKDFSRKPNLNHHIRSVHKGEKPYPCADCGKDFSQQTKLIRHIRCVHHGEKSNPCIGCGKYFSTRWNLSVHIRTVHNGEKPHRCHVCDKGFGQSVTLRTHIRVVHCTE